MTPAETQTFAESLGTGALFVDAFTAAEYGIRPSLTDDDLDDMPTVKAWLSTPLALHHKLSHEDKTKMLQAGTIRMLRVFAKDIHRRKLDDHSKG